MAAATQPDFKTIEALVQSELKNVPTTEYNDDDIAQRTQRDKITTRITKIFTPHVVREYVKTLVDMKIPKLSTFAFDWDGNGIIDVVCEAKDIYDACLKFDTWLETSDPSRAWKCHKSIFTAIESPICEFVDDGKRLNPIEFVQRMFYYMKHASINGDPHIRQVMWIK
jgi:hypothetical protein